MASKTGSGLLVVVVVVVAGAFFAPKLFGVMGSLISDVTGANDAKVVGEGDAAIMVAVDATAKVAPCATEKILQERQCAGLRILVVDSARMPFIARNTKLAWESGRPAILTANRGKQQANRRAACPGSFQDRTADNATSTQWPALIRAAVEHGRRKCRDGRTRARVPCIAISIRKMASSSW